MLSVSHKSSSDNDSKSAANVHRKAGSQQEETKRESRNDHTASLQRVIQDGNAGNSIAAIQTKLSVGQPDDKYEVEAESKADRVMSMAQPVSESVQTKPVVGAISRMIQTQAEEEEVHAQFMEEEPDLQAKELEEESVQRQAGEEEEEVQAKSQEEEPEVQAQEMEEEKLQRKSDSESTSSKAGSSFESSLSAIKGAGDPLPGAVRSYMELRFGADFSNVRVHTGGEAADLSQNINAQAFTHGRDIYFNEGKYNPDSSSGKHLIAHELTHTVQQGAAVQTKGTTTQTSSKNNRVQRSWLSDAASWVGDRVSDAAEWVGDSLEAGKDWLMGWIRDHVTDVRGYRLFTVALGEDPITGEHVDRNGRNFIEAGLDIIPNGAAYKRKLEREGGLAEAAAWVDEQIVLLQELNPTRIAGNFSRFWSRLSIADIRNPRRVLTDLLRIFSTPINVVIQFARNAANKFLEIVKSYVKAKVKDYIKDQQSPTFYPLLRVILAEDPITGEEVERSGANILRGFIRLHPDGDEQLAQMEETGSFQRAANWVDRSIIRIRNIASGLKAAFLSIWDAITDINTLLHPIATFRRIYNNFRVPLSQLADFMWEVGSMILKFIKDALLSRLSAFARNTRGYPLITVLLGKDPFTGRQVERNVENIVRGFMSLMEGGEEKFEKMKETGAIARLNSWLEGALARLNITWEYIRGLFMSAWRSFSILDIAQPFEAFARIVRLFGPPIRRLFNFVVEVIKKIIEIVLQIMNFPSDLIASIFQKTVPVIQQIKRDPIGFIKNLMLGVKQGFIQFFDRIGTHLMNGVTGWLFGELEEAGITPPREITFRSILGLVMEVLGITADRIFEKIGERIGHERMERLRGMIDRVQGIWSFVRDVMERGPVAIWERVQEQLSNLWDMVLDRIKSWIMERIVNRVTAKLLTMLDPTGIMAVVNGFIAFYNAIQSFIRYFREMLETVNRFVDGVRAIASGNVNPAANKLEEALGNAMPIAIGFLANQVGLSGLGRRIGEMIEAVQERVDQAIDWLIEKAMKAGSAILNMGKSVVGAVIDWWKSRKKVRTQDSKQHEIFFDGSGTSARLMIASTPQPYTKYLDSLKGSHDLTEEQLTPAKSKAREVEEEKSKTVSDEKQQEHGAKINNLIHELVDETAKIPLSSAGGTNTPPLYGPVRQGFGTLARLGYLQAPRNDMGSEPSVSNTREFNDINMRRKGEGAYYVKGHLLNDNLDGLGTTWSNLTPLTVKANADHKTDFENPVKKAVNGTIARGANPDETKGHVRDFSVRAIYGRRLPAAYNTLISEETDEVPPGMDDDTNPFDMARLLRAEQYVPTQLVCQAQVKYEEGEEEPLNETITNNIQYGQLSNYSLTENPRQDYVLADQINFEAETKQKAVQELMELSAIGPARAIKIYDGLIESGRIYNFKKQIGITKKTIEKNNPGYHIKGGTYNG